MNPTPNITVRAMSAPWRAGVEILIKPVNEGPSQPQQIGRLVFEEFNELHEVAPSAVLRRDAAQVLMDDLWASGFRPTEGTGSAGSLAATQKHLEDMRTLVFNPPAKA